MREIQSSMETRAFERQLRDLLRSRVAGLSTTDQMALVRRHVDALLADQSALGFSANFEPWVPGRRPDDEHAYPGLGSSEAVALFHLGRTPDDCLTLLIRCRDHGRATRDFPAGADVLGTIQALDHAGHVLGVVAGWERRDLLPLLRRPAAFTSDPLRPAAQALDLNVEQTFAAARVPVDPQTYLGFASHFHQRFRILLDVELHGVRLTGGEHEFEIYNEQLFGSLYQRLVHVLLPRDTERQSGKLSRSRATSIQAHPWYPVLSIGMQKARFYMQAITGDLVHQQRMLTDPGWLLRVGLYLELLTCLGVAEAVKDEVDILTPDERRCLEQSPQFEPIRRYLDVNAWKKVWALREISFGGGDTAPGALNLMRKKAATLGFLHAHHEDLKHAIELAGPNLHNAQETWHRVFRDAERAVLRMNADAFPELAQFSDGVRDFALWHQQGQLGGLRFMPGQITGMFGDQDGIFPSACRQYRESMNHIAAWARARGLMEYTGTECVPSSASLLEAYLAQQHGRLAGLQRRDGYAGVLEVKEEAAARPTLAFEAIAELLGKVELFSVLSVDELLSLALQVRPIELGHLERILIQGREGSSLFILQAGTLEVIRSEEGTERQIALLQPPAVIGELSFLAGETRAATVRALDEATVLEVGAGLLRPLVEQRPAILEKLQALLAERGRQRAQPERPSMAANLRRAIFGS